jgi:hypothetical protein
MGGQAMGQAAQITCMRTRSKFKKFMKARHEKPKVPDL